MPIPHPITRTLKYRLAKWELKALAASLAIMRKIRFMVIMGPDAEKERAELAERHGQEDEEITESRKSKLFESVGAALTTWAGLEEILVGLACLLIGTDISKAGVLMYSIFNFGTTPSEARPRLAGRRVPSRLWRPFPPAHAFVRGRRYHRAKPFRRVSGLDSPGSIDAIPSRPCWLNPLAKA
jgi:hypothetical protein